MKKSKEFPRVGVGIAVVHDGKVLIGKRKGSHGNGEWSFPGGHLEFGETVEDCVRRELEEETGLRAISILRGPWSSDIFENNKHYVSVFMFVTEFIGDLKNREPHKCECWEWFHFDQLPTPLFLPMQSFFKIVRG